MTKLILAIVLCGLFQPVIARDNTKPVYVGQGRYACSDNSYQCAQIQQNNARLEEQQRYERDRRYEESHDRQRDRDSVADEYRWRQEQRQ